jgi:photosystem II stability/assembly factor-like uncharacterized protein
LRAPAIQWALAICAILVLGRAQAAEDLKVYPLAAKSLVLDAARAGPALVAVGDRGFILKSTDDGVTWAQQKSPVTVMLTGLRMQDAQNGWAVGHDATILKTEDGGTTWTVKFQDAELDTPLFDVLFDDAQRGLAVGAYGLIQKTTNGGATWSEVRVSEDEPHLYGVVRTDDGALLAVGETGGIFKSVDQGEVWELLPSPYDGTWFGVLATTDGALFIYGLRGNLYRSNDTARSWTKIETGTEVSLTGAAQRADGSIVVTGLSGAVLTSKDGNAFTMSTLADREALSGAVDSPGGKLVLFGEKGLRPAAEVKQ